MKSLTGKEVRWLSGRLIFLSGLTVTLFISCESKQQLRPLVLTARDSAENLRKTNQAFVAIRSLEKEILTGDLVTRTGNDFTSESLRKLNRRNKTYSHCGIASIENDTLFIYHALGGEWNPDEKLRRDTWVIFAEPYSNNGIGQFRFAITGNATTRLISQVQKLHKNGLPFDMDFDLATDERMYCAEFICKSFTGATKNEISFTPSQIGNFRFIGVDDLFLHPSCKKMAEIKYR